MLMLHNLGRAVLTRVVSLPAGSWRKQCRLLTMGPGSLLGSGGAWELRWSSCGSQGPQPQLTEELFMLKTRLQGAL